MFQVAFCDARNNDDLLFKEYLEAAPRVGESVSYSFEPTHPSDWDPQAKVERERASDLVHCWTVVSVVHVIRRLSVVGSAHHTIFVMIAPADNQQTPINQPDQPNQQLKG